jgi:hypothetical protein
MNEESIEFASILIPTQIGLTMTKPCKDIRIKLIFPLHHNKQMLLLLLAIVLSVILRYTDSDYPFGFYKLFLQSTTSAMYEIVKHFTDIQ